MPSKTCNVVVLLSGSGSNLQALIDSCQGQDSPVRIRAVVSNRADAYGLQRAAAAGIDSVVLDHTQFDGREAFDAALMARIDGFAPDLVVLAGFMRILSGDFVRHYQAVCSTSTRRCCPSTRACIRIAGHWKLATPSMAAAYTS